MHASLPPTLPPVSRCPGTHGRLAAAQTGPPEDVMESPRLAADPPTLPAPTPPTQPADHPVRERVCVCVCVCVHVCVFEGERHMDNVLSMHTHKHQQQGGH